MQSDYPESTVYIIEVDKYLSGSYHMYTFDEDDIDNLFQGALAEATPNEDIITLYKATIPDLDYLSEKHGEEYALEYINANMEDILEASEIIKQVAS